MKKEEQQQKNPCREYHCKSLRYFESKVGKHLGKKIYAIIHDYYPLV